MIRSFGDKQTAAVFAGHRARGLPSFMQDAARRKLKMLDAAASLDDLRTPPGNRLEVLAGRRKGQYSIRINHQWRICFAWDGKDAHEAAIVDYH
ncbi:MAG: type II toxin-antitoxin system RelE/ParE family toxin [Burkholderiaceae bacterium]|nr:type II toxin-antitoxin system RelE/ParE family toxin [Burkholderiaceae bacterium]